MVCFSFCSPNLKKCHHTGSSQLPYLSLFLLFYDFQLRGLGKLKKIHFRKSLPGATGSVYVTEVHEALPRRLRCADVISMSLVLPCSAIVCSRSRQCHPGAKRTLQRTGGCSLQLLEGTVEAALQVRVGHNQDTFLIPRHQADLLRNAPVQLCQHRKIPTKHKDFE